MSVTLEFERIVRSELLRCVAIAENHFGRPFLYPTLDYTLTGATAGQAYSHKNLIRLNVPLLINHPDELRVTVAHEFAHIVDRTAYAAYHRTHRADRKKGSLHGPTWKQVMKLFGMEPTRCHNMDVSEVKRKKNVQQHAYTCDCGAVLMLSTIKHNHIVRGAKSYRHVPCGQLIRPEMNPLNPRPPFSTIPVTIRF